MAAVKAEGVEVECLHLAVLKNTRFRGLTNVRIRFEKQTAQSFRACSREASIIIETQESTSKVMFFTI